jgi:hypothetical protein
MSTEDLEQRAESREQQSAERTRLPILGLIDSIQQVCTAGTPPEKFVNEVLRGFVALSDAVYGAFWRVDRQSRQLGIAAEVMPRVSESGARAWGPVLGELALGVVQQTIIRFQPVSEPPGELLTGQAYMALGFPVRGDDSAAGCVTIVVRAESPILSDAGLAMLRLLGDFGLLYSSTRAAARYEKFYESLSGAWKVVGEALAFAGPHEMAQVLSDRSRAAFGAQRVSVGFVKGNKVAVSAISGEDMLDKRSNFVRLIQAAQAEVLVSGEAGFYTASASAEQRAEQTTRNPQHERLAREGGAEAVYSVPLRKEGDVIGVWTVELGKGASLTDEARQVIDVTAGQIGPLLHLARQNARNVFKRAGDGSAAAAKWLLGKDHPWRKAAAVAGIVVLGVAVFGRADFNAVGNCSLECSFRQVYTAPFDTTIRSVAVRPGDTVGKGQTIVVFDCDDLVLKLRETQSNKTGAEKEMSTYLAQQKMSKYAESEARRDSLAAQADLLERQIARAEVHADFAGIVVTGDLTRDIGRPVRMGEQLIEVAPLDKLLLDVEVQQGDIAYVEAGQGGMFTTKARPNLSMPFEVDKVRPTPETRNGASVYIAEATVANPEGWLRPGMEGAAKVRIGRQNITWVYTRKLINWLRLHLWW